MNMFTNVFARGRQHRRPSVSEAQRTQRKQRIYELTHATTGNVKKITSMTSLFDRPITAASDDGVCWWHAAKLWQTRAKLLKLNLICII